MKIRPPKGYYLLSKNEYPKKGDIFLSDKKWCESPWDLLKTVGHMVDYVGMKAYARKIRER